MAVAAGEGEVFVGGGGGLLAGEELAGGGLVGVGM